MVSKKSDDFGYDIISLDNEGKTIYIEVKSTKNTLGNIDFFYTENELNTAKKLGEQYKIYLVFDVYGAQPVIKNIGNPIITNMVEIRPIKYAVSVCLDD